MRPSKKAETQVLAQAIMKARSAYDIEGIVHGTISSRFQNDIFRKVCSQFGLANIAPLWNVRPIDYLQTLIDMTSTSNCISIRNGS